MSETCITRVYWIKKTKNKLNTLFEIFCRPIHFKITFLSLKQWCITWTLAKYKEKKLDGNCTRMLRATLNKSWKQHLTKQQLCGHLPPISKTIQIRLAGHCWRSKDELINDVVLWTSSHGRASVRRPVRNYLQQLCMNTGCHPKYPPEARNNRDK